MFSVVVFMVVGACSHGETWCGFWWVRVDSDLLFFPSDTVISLFRSWCMSLFGVMSSSHPHKIHLARGSHSMQDVVKTLSQDAVHNSVSKSGERGIVFTTG